MTRILKKERAVSFMRWQKNISQYEMTVENIHFHVYKTKMARTIREEGKEDTGRIL